ncbi:hypothetical protein BJV77DRAFT_431966 [Russula vinacea]|nr:hypothetical protein BJV77DRAFT_431966 [Russula vinacea]
MFRRRAVTNNNSSHLPNAARTSLNGPAGVAQHRPPRAATMSVAGALLDYSLMLFLVFGGCCSNVWAYEELLRAEPNVGPALTFSQMLFITAQQLPSFITWDKSSSSFPLRFKPRQVPITQWLLQVTTFASGTLLNNIVFAFNVPPRYRSYSAPQDWPCP